MFKEAYQKTEEETDDKVISSENMLSPEFGLKFLSYVDLSFVKEVTENLDWYLNSFRASQQFIGFNEILLNVGYPSRMEREFLKHVEHS